METGALIPGATSLEKAASSNRWWPLPYRPCPAAFSRVGRPLAPGRSGPFPLVIEPIRSPFESACPGWHDQAGVPKGGPCQFRHPRGQLWLNVRPSLRSGDVCRASACFQYRLAPPVPTQPIRRRPVRSRFGAETHGPIGRVPDRLYQLRTFAYPFRTILCVFLCEPSCSASAPRHGCTKRGWERPRRRRTGGTLTLRRSGNA